MLKYIFSSLLVYIVPFCLVAQDSLVNYSELHFSSEFEHDVFRKFFQEKNEKQALALLLSVSSSANGQELSNVTNRINGVTQLLISSGIEKKKPEKKIKAIYEQVHTTFLKKYELENRFIEIFSNGNYNCVTATALYSLIFDDLKIPYEIKEEPTHVYLLAYPNAGNILVETTTPLFGFLTFDSKFKENFIENLKNQKVIGSSEIDTKSTEELFNTYYFQNEKIDIRKLIGIHYLNDALFKNDHGKTIEAFQQAEKAYLFYPSSRCEYLLMNFGVNALAKEKLTPKEKSVFIGKLSRNKNQGITNEMIKGEFANLTQDVLFRDNNKILHKECFNLITSGLDDKELIDDISYIYYYENGRVLYNQGNYNMAKPFFKQALKIQPNNVDLGGTFVNVLSQSFRTAKTNKPVLDTLLFYQSNFPSLGQNNTFNSMIAMTNAIQFGEEYHKGNPVDGELYRSNFETLITANNALNINSAAVGEAYSEACVYYFKKGQKTKAKSILQKGLEISPNSYELRMRKQMLSN